MKVLYVLTTWGDYFIAGDMQVGLDPELEPPGGNHRLRNPVQLMATKEGMGFGPWQPLADIHKSSGFSFPNDKIAAIYPVDKNVQDAYTQMVTGIITATATPGPIQLNG